MEETRLVVVDEIGKCGGSSALVQNLSVVNRVTKQANHGYHAFCHFDVHNI